MRDQAQQGSDAGQASRVRVRPMEDKDRTAVEALLYELNAVGESYTHDRNLAEDAGQTSLSESEGWIARDGGAVLVAELDGAVVGTAIVAHVSLDFNVRPDLRPRSYVLELAVAPAKRLQGIGRLLVDAAEQHARDHGHCALLLNAAAGNEPAMALYRGRGFETYSYEMIKKLAPF